MLFRGSSDIALGAIFADVLPAGQLAESSSHAAPASGESLEIARLEAENRRLREELGTLRQEWATALAEAQDKAEEAAARKHRDDDERRLRALEAMTRSASDELARLLGEQTEGLATSLACDALSILVEAQSGDTQWLARVIAQRLARARHHSRVQIHASPDLTDDLARAGGLTGCEMVSDAGVAAGTVVIKLALGEITIDPREGAGRLICAMRGGMVDA